MNQEIEDRAVCFCDVADGAAWGLGALPAASLVLSSGQGRDHHDLPGLAPKLEGGMHSLRSERMAAPEGWEQRMAACTGPWLPVTK